MTEPCPQCKGAGRIAVDAKAGAMGAMKIHVCTRCNGSGVVPVALESRMMPATGY